MEKVYNICMIIGIVIPLTTILLGGLFDFLGIVGEGISHFFEGLNPDLGDGAFPLLPISLNSICAGLLLFGTIGKLLDGRLDQNLVIGIAVVTGYLTALAIQFFIRKLKRVENTTYTKEQLLLFDAKVIHTILPGCFGSVSVTTYDGITTSYPAKAEGNQELIKQDTIVQILRFEKNVAIVQVKDISYKYDVGVKRYLDP